MNNSSRPIVLIVLDGWGIAPASEGNGVTLAQTPNYHKYLDSYPAMTLLASGEAVGLSWGEMGNSEVGHLNLGAGRVFYQNLPRIDKAIEDGEFYNNPALMGALEHVKKNKSRLHLLGLMSEGKVHSVNRHCYAILEMAKKNRVDEVYVHAFLDGRDSPYNTGVGFIKELEKTMSKIGVGKIASVHGRFFAMDRDNRWERTEKSYRALVLGESEEHFFEAEKAVKNSYDKKVYDEEFVPVVIGRGGKPTAVIRDNDAVIFFNYRGDRTRQLTHALGDSSFDKFPRPTKLQGLEFVTLTEYEKGLPVKVAFPKEAVKTSLPKILSEKGFRQLHVAETEKYAHVTFFFGGGVEEPYENEERVVIPSPKVSSYAEAPEMSARKVTDILVQEILKKRHDFIIVNYANPDMVGHTGEVAETVRAIEYVDKCLGELVEATLSEGGTAMVVADHGNAEELINLQTGEKDKEHSTNPVPCLIIGREFEGKTMEDVRLVGNDLSLIQPIGLLSDVAPTILKLMNIDIPEEMTGRALI